MPTSIETVQHFIAGAFTKAWPTADATTPGSFLAAFAHDMSMGGLADVDIIHIVNRRPIVMTERVGHFSRDDGTTISWPMMGRSKSTMGSSPPGGTTWTSVSSPRKCAGEQSSCDGISDRDGCSRTPRLRDQRRASKPVLGHSFLRRFAQRSNGCDHGVFLQPVGLEMAVRIVHLVVVPPKEV